MARPTATEAIKIAERRAELVRMVTDGESWDTIVEELGYKNRAVAYNDFRRAKTAAGAELRENVTAYRDRELAALDALEATAVQVLNRYHVTISGGKIVRDGQPIIDVESGEAVIAEDAGEPLEDDGPVLAAIDRLLKISESRRKLLGLDSPVKLEATGTIRYLIEGPDGPIDIGQLT
jgi:hypothetical protein